MRRRAAPRMRECRVTVTTYPPASFKLTRLYTTLKMRLEENERATFCVFKLNMRWFVFSKLFNPFMSQLKREGPCQIEWLTFMASGHSSQTEMSTSALISYSSARQVKFLPPGRRLWNEGSRTNSNFSASICVVQEHPPTNTHAHTRTPRKRPSHSCLVSTWNLAGCDCAEKGDTFQTYHGVSGLEEPIGGQLTAQSLLPPSTENKKALWREKKSH